MNEENTMKLNQDYIIDGISYEIGVEYQETTNKYLLYVISNKVNDEPNALKIEDAFNNEKDAIDAFFKVNKNGYIVMTYFAYKLACYYHKGQKDKAGLDYINHPMHVSLKFKNDPYRAVVGILHDIVEDTEMTLEELSSCFPKDIVEAVDAISRRKGEGYKETDKEYFERIKTNEIAIDVKIQDLIHNLDINRLNKLEPSVEEAMRIKRYGNNLYDLISYKNSLKSNKK